MVTIPPAGPRRAPSLALLAWASSLSPFGMAIVLPILPGIAAHFGTGIADAQYVIAAYLFGLGITQPYSGLLCDRLGRRPVLLGGTALFTAATIGCALAPTLPVLVALRFLQAVGISVGTVATRAIIRDTSDPLECGRALARLAAAMGLAPVLAPVLGGLLVAALGPPGVFAFTALVAVAVLGWVYRSLPETRPAQTAGEAVGLLAGYAELLRSRQFVGNTLLYGFIQGGFFAFLAVGAQVFQSDLGLGQQVFGAIWGALGVIYVASAALASRLTARLGIRGVLITGAGTTLAGGWGILLLNLASGVTLWTLTGPMIALMLASGFVTPMAMAGAVSGRPALAGRAAGLSSAVGLVLSGAFSIAAGVLFTGPFLPVAVLIAAAATATAAMLPLALAAR